MKCDVFISHASEDKQDVAQPLAEILSLQGLRVWLDANELSVGDSLREKIDQGLAESRYGIAILSPAFFAKDWPKRELNALVAREVAGQKVILPVWHGVDQQFVASYSPILADKLAASTQSGLGCVARELIHAMPDVTARLLSPPPPARHRPTRIVIPRLKLDSPVVEVGWRIVEEDGERFSRWEVADLFAGWHRDSAFPGSIGNVVISGHHNIKGEVFRHIVDLERGDEIASALIEFADDMHTEHGRAMAPPPRRAGEVAGLTYRVSGAGPPLLLLPLSLAPSQWEPLLPMLNRRYCTIALSGPHLVLAQKRCGDFMVGGEGCIF